jgi:proliferating cell nuclear antigen
MIDNINLYKPKHVFTLMKLKLDHPKLFSDVISIISELVIEVKLKINKDGMKIIAVDPANVAMIAFNLPVTAFSQLEVEEETIGINLESLKAVLRRCNANSALVMETKDNFLKLELIDKIKREFTLTMLDLEGKEKPIPNLEFATKIEMNSMDFSDAVEDCSIVADSCGFEATPDRFTIFSKGPLNSANLTYSSDEVKIETTVESKSRYSLEYLQKMIKATKISDQTTLNFANDYPLRIEFSAPMFTLAFILAPRVETED